MFVALNIKPKHGKLITISTAYQVDGLLTIVDVNFLSTLKFLHALVISGKQESTTTRRNKKR